MPHHIFSSFTAIPNKPGLLLGKLILSPGHAIALPKVMKVSGGEIRIAV
jgi:hypothetical protein